MDEYWLVDQGKISVFDGDLEDYHAYIAQRPDEISATTTSDSAKPVVDRKEQKRIEAEKRQRLAPLRKKQQAAEKQMEKLQAKLSDIEEIMADTGLYEAARKDELQKLLQNQAQLKAELEEVEMQWMELSEELEAFDD